MLSIKRIHDFWLYFFALTCLMFTSCRSTNTYSGYFPGTTFSEGNLITIYLKPYYKNGYLHLDLNYQRPVNQNDKQIVLLDKDLKIDRNFDIKGIKKHQQYWLINFNGTEPILLPQRTNSWEFQIKSQGKFNTNKNYKSSEEFGFHQYNFTPKTLQLKIALDGQTNVIEGSCAIVRAYVINFNGKKFIHN